MSNFHLAFSKLREIRGAQSGKRARVLLYHSISDTPQDPFSVSPAMFRSQMSWLQENNFRVISTRELVTSIQQNLNLPRTVALTFDDALVDFFDLAIPILNEFHYPAAVFVPTGLAGQDGNWSSSSMQHKVMAEGQLLQAAQMGFELGSHTAHHVSLPEQDPPSLHAELQESMAYLVRLTGKDRLPLAYPYGRGGLREQAAARLVGYTCAFLAGGLWGAGKGSNLFALPREMVQQENSLQDFSRIVSGQMDFQRVMQTLTNSVRRLSPG
jgi:peptidoglycan/xylan/chitin deacetylase (PgdA/CDA1 family)